MQPGVSSAVTARDKYIKAEACYNKLCKSPKKQKYRHNWLNCIKKFQAVYRHDPSGPWAAAGLYMSGKLYQELYKKSYKKSDKKEALDLFERIVKRFPKSRYKYKAAVAIRSFSISRGQKIASTKTAKKQIKTAKKQKKNNKTCTITGLRFWSNPNYTRIVIDADRETSYVHRLLRKDPSIKKPQRLYVDLKSSILGKTTEKRIP
ncbi:MAG: AMIN domain-containing protein, partial [Desulfobacteraceae bacterium]|nr:AMIN domain-containing protein [Desulfobacteraceae bacterium]